MSGLGELDLHLAGEGRHERLYERLGAHCVDGGVRFAVWAPNARAVSVVGDWNFWSEGADPLRPLASSGIWEGVAANAAEGQRYKLPSPAPTGSRGSRRTRTRRLAEVPPENASIVYHSRFRGPTTRGSPAAVRRPADAAVLRLRGPRGLVAPGPLVERARGAARPLRGGARLHPRRADAGDAAPLCAVVGLPGQRLLRAASRRSARRTTSGSSSTRFHPAGIGVLLDWVPAHFPRDEWALARFDGTALYEHDDPRRGSHPDWGTLIFNLSATRCGTSCSPTPSTGCASSTPTACGSTPSPRCSTSTTRREPGNGCRTSTAGARTSRRSPSCAS